MASAMLRLPTRYLTPIAEVGGKGMLLDYFDECGVSKDDVMVVELIRKNMCSCSRMLQAVIACRVGHDDQSKLQFMLRASRGVCLAAAQFHELPFGYGRIEDGVMATHAIHSEQFEPVLENVREVVDKIRSQGGMINHLEYTQGEMHVDLMLKLVDDCFKQIEALVPCEALKSVMRTYSSARISRDKLSFIKDLEEAISRVNELIPTERYARTDEVYNYVHMVVHVLLITILKLLCCWHTTLKHKETD
eukprot:480343-Hanusia_phi.AAC.4